MYCKDAMSCNYVIEDTIEKCGGQFHNDDDEADCLRVDCDENDYLQTQLISFLFIPATTHNFLFLLGTTHNLGAKGQTF